MADIPSYALVYMPNNYLHIQRMEDGDFDFFYNPHEIPNIWHDFAFIVCPEIEALEEIQRRYPDSEYVVGAGSVALSSFDVSNGMNLRVSESLLEAIAIADFTEEHRVPYVYGHLDAVFGWFVLDGVMRNGVASLGWSPPIAPEVEENVRAG